MLCVIKEIYGTCQASDSSLTPRLTFDIAFWPGGKRWSRGMWSRGVENVECGKHGTWKTRGLMQKPRRGKHGAWKTRDLV